MKRVESLAGSGKAYVAAQVRARGEYLHIQAEGPSVNRPYGISADLRPDSKLKSKLKVLKWLSSQPHTLTSLAGTGAKYVPAQLRLEGDKIRVQVRGSPLNRRYGLAFEVDANCLPELRQFLELAGVAFWLGLASTCQNKQGNEQGGEGNGS